MSWICRSLALMEVLVGGAVASMSSISALRTGNAPSNFQCAVPSVHEGVTVTLGESASAPLLFCVFKNMNFR